MVQTTYSRQNVNRNLNGTGIAKGQDVVIAGNESVGKSGHLLKRSELEQKQPDACGMRHLMPQI